MRRQLSGLSSCEVATGAFLVLAIGSYLFGQSGIAAIFLIFALARVIAVVAQRLDKHPSCEAKPRPGPTDEGSPGQRVVREKTP